jgi:hypothetical protein
MLPLPLCFRLRARNCAARVCASGALFHCRPSSSAGDLQMRNNMVVDAQSQTVLVRQHSSGHVCCCRNDCTNIGTCSRQQGCAWWRMPGAGRLLGGQLLALPQLQPGPPARVTSRLVAPSAPADNRVCHNVKGEEGMQKCRLLKSRTTSRRLMTAVMLTGHQ